MARVRLFFKGLKNYNFPNDYDDRLSFLFVNQIKNFLNNTKFRDFHFFTFSDFVIENVDSYETVLTSIDGILSVVLSSSNESFLRSAVSFLVKNNTLCFEENKLSLFKFTFLDDVNFFYGEANFISVSPILLKNYSKKEGLFSYLERNLIKSYCECYKLDKCNLTCQIKTLGDVFQEVVDDGLYYYILDLYITGDSELISFAYDNGLGDDTSKGFGMIDLY